LCVVADVGLGDDAWAVLLVGAFEVAVAVVVVAVLAA